MDDYVFLNGINSPEDLKKLTMPDKIALCDEIRDFIVRQVGKTGGHLASNLGSVELTVALHDVFSAPTDHIIFDVGHQAYTHKILTGRKDKFSTLRQRGGLSGFTKRSESEYDCFGAGHSSTSVSAALGFAESDRLRGSSAYTIAILGDGAFTGGMIHEALNNCDSRLRLVIILNENEMSISKNIGRFAGVIAKLRSSRGYYRSKHRTANFIKKIPLIGKGLFNFIKNVKKSFKNALYGSNYFEDLGFYYLGPCDGNDLQSVENLLNEAKQYGGACIVHLKTKKGKGLPEAEKDPDRFHCISPEGKAPEKNFSQLCGQTLVDLARSDERICAVTAAMSRGTGLSMFEKEFPDRFFDVGIAEEHALTFSAGLAANGMKPYAAIYSTFLQRGYDNIFHDIAIQSLPVRLLVDRAGISFSDGQTHHGIFDVSFLSSIPGIDIYTPACFESLKEILTDTVDCRSPVAVRYPNDHDLPRINDIFRFGSRYVRRNFEKTPERVIITYGRIVSVAIKAAEMLGDCGVILLEKLTPYTDISNELKTIISPDTSIVFLEEGIRTGGAGMIFCERLRDIASAYRIVAIDGPLDPKIIHDDPFEDYGIGVSDVITAFGTEGNRNDKKVT